MSKTKVKTSKAAQIRARLQAGLTPQQVAAELGVTRQYVYGVRYYDEKISKKKRGPGRPKGSKSKAKPVPTNAHQPPAPVPPPAPLGFKARLRVLFTGRV